MSCLRWVNVHILKAFLLLLSYYIRHAHPTFNIEAWIVLKYIDPVHWNPAGSLHSIRNENVPVLLWCQEGKIHSVLQLTSSSPIPGNLSLAVFFSYLASVPRTFLSVLWMANSSINFIVYSMSLNFTILFKTSESSSTILTIPLAFLNDFNHHSAY